MRPNIRICRLFGVDIGLHYSWVIIAFFIVFALAGQFHFSNPQWAPGMVWSLAILTALLFFGSIVVHELSHALVARRRGIAVKSITLFALGGVANMETESSDAKSEFLMAIVGPLTSVAIGLLFLGLASMTGWSPGSGTPSSPLWASFVWLGYINIFLAVFNMIPGYPLDGGRVLRSIIWRINGNMMRSMRIAARAGQFIAVAFIVIGIFRAFTGAGIGGLWLALLGWFLSEAATASYGEVQTSVAVAGVQARDVMSKTFPAIDGNLSLRTLAEEFLMQGERYFIVLEGGRASGLVTVQELKQIQRERWPFVPISRIAVPLERMRTISPESNIAEALRIMVQENLHELPVISNGELAGVINRSHMLQFLQMRADLKAA